jgi:PmbA protein
VEVLEKNILINLAEKAVNSAQTLGANEAEAYVYEGQATNVGIDLGQISKANRIIDRGVGIRVVYNRGIGFAYTNMVDTPEAIKGVATRALSAAKASRPDPDWKGFPQQKPYGTTESTFDKEIIDLNPEDLVKVTAAMLDAAEELDKRVFSIEGGMGSGYVANAIANSNGIVGYDQGTIVECSLATLAQDGGSVTPVCFEFNAARNFSLDPKWVGREAAKLALKAMKPKSVETQITKVILAQFALQDLFSNTLMGAVKADNVQRGQSPFKGRIEEQVASEQVTIYDDGLYAGGLRTSVFDGEGVPHQATPVIENGVLRNFLYDTYSAKKDGVESTGNAARSGYLCTPVIGTSNFHILPQNKTPEQMIEEVNDGLIVYYLQGAHSSNPVSGEFSVVATPSWKIKGGEIEHSCKAIMITGNIFELLKNISIVGGNERQMGSIIAPWILVDKVKVIGN